MAKKEIFASCELEVKSGKLSPKDYDGLLVALYQDEELPKEVFAGVKPEGDPEGRIGELIKNKEIRATFREFTILHFASGKKVQRLIVLGERERGRLRQWGVEVGAERRAHSRALAPAAAGRGVYGRAYRAGLGDLAPAPQKDLVAVDLGRAGLGLR